MPEYASIFDPTKYRELSKRMAAPVESTPRKRPKCRAHEVYSDAEERCIDMVDSAMSTEDRIRKTQRRLAKNSDDTHWGGAAMREELRHFLGTLLLERHRACMGHHHNETECMRAGCLWKKGGLFASGSCMGPELDGVRLSSGPTFLMEVRTAVESSETRGYRATGGPNGCVVEDSGAVAYYDGGDTTPNGPR